MDPTDVVQCDVDGSVCVTHFVSALVVIEGLFRVTRLVIIAVLYHEPNIVHRLRFIKLGCFEVALECFALVSSASSTTI